MKAIARADLFQGGAARPGGLVVMGIGATVIAVTVTLELYRIFRQEGA